MATLNAREQAVVQQAVESVNRYQEAKNRRTGPLVIPGVIGISDNPGREPVDILRVARELLDRGIGLANPEFIKDGDRTLFRFKPLAPGANYTDDIVGSVFSRYRKTGDGDGEIIYHPKD